MISILFASPRKDGNTRRLLDIFIEELELARESYRVFEVYDMDLRGCLACRSCQEAVDSFGCPIQDDTQLIFESILESRLLVLASPIYSWSVPAPLKAPMDRLVYGMNKYYGSVRANLWEGKALGALVSCGYPVERGADLFDESLKRYARHSKLNYLGMGAEKDPGYGRVFMDEEKRARTRALARRFIKEA